MVEFISENVGLIIGIGVIVIIVIIALLTGYLKAPPDKAYIISGFRKEPRVLIGRAGIKIPFFERKNELNLQLIPVDVKTSQAVPTADYINIQVDATVNVKIGTKDELLKIASENFLDKGINEIRAVAREVLEGNIREIVGKMSLQDMVSDRQKFAEQVKENAAPDLSAMGLDIISFNVQNFTDSNKVIEDLGIDNITKIKKQAAIAKAESEKEIKVAQSRANKEANDARVASETEIATRNNELSIKQAELKKAEDIKKAEADAAYKIESERQMQKINVAQAEANIAAEDKNIILKQKEADVREQALTAEIKKKADAEKYAEQQKAEADLYRRQKEAEAQKYEKEKEAEYLKTQAEASKYAKEQEAAGIMAVGEAEAEAIRAKALAEAEGIEKKAEAMNKMNEAAILEMFFNAYPQIMAAAAKPLENVDKITMYGEGNSTKLIEDIVNTTTKVSEGIKESTGINLQSLISGFVGGKLSTVKENTNVETATSNSLTDNNNINEE